MTIRNIIRVLVLAVLWMAVAYTGMCGLIGITSLKFGDGGGAILGICILVMAALIGVIRLISKRIKPSQPPNP
jgi:hypothetical protein